MIKTPTVLRLLSPLLIVMLFAASEARAQGQPTIQFPDASQRANVKQRVGLTDIEIDYARPNKNDREIFGGLVPYGKLWRTGANATTRVKFSDTVRVGDKEIPAGEYGLFTIPTANEWTVIFSKDTKASTADYKQENDAARITVKPETIPMSLETFTIALMDVKGASATLNLIWDNTRVPVKLTTDDIEQVSAQLDAAVKANTTLDPRTAYQAASFYYDNNKDMNQALKWIDQALEKNPNAYFMHMRRAQIQQKLGNKKEAAASAQKTIDILKAGKEPDETAIKNAQQIVDASK
jgi:tetratricopeptide (TPR) repeat protein